MSSIKGWFGEALISIAKKFALDGNVYKAINNVTLPTPNGTTQIDHVIVSRYGIFVIETKNMEGWIFGSANGLRWTQALFGKKSQFQNPLHQNYRHIKALSGFLNLPESCFHSIVCFVGETSKFKTELPENVINGGPFGYINSKTQVLIPDDQVAQIVEAIQTGMLPKTFLGLSTRETRVSHLASLEERHSSTTTCPKCGNPLVIRTVKRGANSGKNFYGCTKFPECRYTRTT